MSRVPNASCAQCGIPVYQRPSETIKFCSKTCYHQHRKPTKKCLFCKKQFTPPRTTSKFCSKSCSNHGRRGTRYKLGRKK